MLFWVRNSDLCMPWWTCIVVSLNYVCLSVLIALLLSIRVYTGSQRAGLSYDMYPPPHMMYTGSQRSGLKGASAAGTPMNSAADHLYGTYSGHMIYMGPSGADNAVPSNELSSRPLTRDIYGTYDIYGTFWGAACTHFCLCRWPQTQTWRG